MSGIADMYDALRASTVELLGYGSADQLTAAQRIRLDRAIMLRLMIDDLQARQMRGEQIDVHAFVSASENLERMVGGNPEAPASETRFGPSHRERLRRLIETTLLAASVDDPGEVERKAELMRREEMAAVVAAGGEIKPAPSAPATVAPPPLRAENVVPFEPKPPPHYLADYQRQHEPWRGAAEFTVPSWPLPR